jgi:hypothetical protein
MYYMPGIDGSGLAAYRQFPRLTRAFDLRCLIIPRTDRSSFEELVDTVAVSSSSSGVRHACLVGKVLQLPVTADSAMKMSMQALIAQLLLNVLHARFFWLCANGACTLPESAVASLAAFLLWFCCCCCCCLHRP